MYMSKFSLSSSSSVDRWDGGKESSAIVAVDRDRNSQHAAKWAVDRLLARGSMLEMVHVRTHHNTHNSHEGKDDGEKEITQLFTSYTGYCVRKGMHTEEVVLDGDDVSKAIIEYAATRGITNIVVGASKHTFMRKFRNPDVPTCLLKNAPDYVSVYVISKGKAVMVKAAKGPAPFSAVLQKQHSIQSDESESSDRGGGSWTSAYPPSPIPIANSASMERANAFIKFPSRDRPLSGARTLPCKDLNDYIDSSRLQKHLSPHDSFSDDLDLPVNVRASSMDFDDSMDFSSASGDSLSSTSKDVEAEMRRLKLELKQTMEMYNTACKEAVMAKQKAAELNQMKMEEARELRHGQEEALALVETEKAKSKAAQEAAEAARRIAELEAQKRLKAERKAKREAEKRKRAMGAVNGGADPRYRRYSIDDIEAATNNFDRSLKIGEGGYGPVFRGVMDHTTVAIKVLKPDASQGREQFQQEVEVLSCMRHPNMVLLLGACPEYGCLVYEYMDYGSLEDRLCRRGDTPPIPWNTRFGIAADIATGLLFLHQAKPEPLVHRDLKPANILLDHNYVTKISDVGLARLVPEQVADEVTQYRMTSAAGTFCYIDPEYQQTGMLGTKSDVYSLGILLLQIITARPPMGLRHHVERAIEKGAFREVLDPAVADWPVEEALAFALLALRCAELLRKDRPDLGTEILPELNRLRSLGQEHDAARISCASTAVSSSAPCSFSNGSWTQ